FNDKTDFRYMVSGGATAQFQFLDNSDGPMMLCASGIHVDVIRAVGQSLPYFPVSDVTCLTNDQDPNYQLQLEWLSDIEQLSKCGNIYGGSQSGGLRLPT